MRSVLWVYVTLSPQVIDWTDDRKPNDNPREGQRLTPGHFSLLGHDPTTDLAFRIIRLAETPE